MMAGMSTTTIDRIASEAQRAGCTFYSRDEAQRLLDTLDETGRRIDDVHQDFGFTQLLGSTGRVVAEVNDHGDRLETSERYVVHVMSVLDGEAFSEEVDVDVLRHSPIDLVATVATAHALHDLEGGWVALVVDGPKFGLY